MDSACILHVFCMINDGLLILIDYCCGTLLYKSGHFHNSRFNGVFRSGTFDRETCVCNLISIVFFTCSLPYVLYVNFLYDHFFAESKSLMEDQGNSAEDLLNPHCLSLRQCMRMLKRKKNGDRASQLHNSERSSESNGRMGTGALTK